MDEYWSDDGLATEWRKKMKIGKELNKIELWREI